MSVKIEGKLFRGRPSIAVMKAAQTTRTKALKLTRDRSRVDTGAMKSGWSVNVKGGSSGVQLSISNDVFYTKYQEFGTSKIAPMYAATKSMVDAKTIFQQELQKELKSSLGGRIDYLVSSAADALSVVLRGAIE